MADDNIAEFQAALTGRQALEALTEAETPDLLALDGKTLTQSLRSVLSEADRAAITEAYGNYVAEKIRLGIQARRDGWVDDNLAFMKPWDFELSQIRVPVLVMHGMQDKALPAAHGLWLAEHIPGAEARLLPEDGHSTMSVKRIPQVHDWLLSKW
jgi:pimeloyl-ACP methyl ester carboxylesterase